MQYSTVSHQKRVKTKEVKVPTVLCQGGPLNNKLKERGVKGGGQKRCVLISCQAR
jgi:hypothetical protein